MKNTADADYGLMPADSLIQKILYTQRRKLFAAFEAFSDRDSSETSSVLHVGLAPSPLLDNPNYLNAWSAPHDQSRITSYLIDTPGRDSRRPVAHTTADRPHHDALHLPFRDGQFDWTFCNEVIEHVGGFEKQYTLVKELARVSRKGVFVTTSNRRHPIEFNTGLPLLHWLPDAWWRRLLKWMGKGAWASESVLNLLDSHTLYKIARLLPGKPKHDVGHKRVGGIKAHFFLMVEKHPEDKSGKKEDETKAVA